MFDDPRIVVSNGRVECAVSRKMIRVDRACRAEFGGMVLFLDPDVVRKYRGHEDDLQRVLQDVVIRSSGLPFDLERMGVN